MMPSIGARRLLSSISLVSWATWAWAAPMAALTELTWAWAATTAALPVLWRDCCCRSIGCWRNRA
jgi:hypothetical protein